MPPQSRRHAARHLPDAKLVRQFRRIGADTVVEIMKPCEKASELLHENCDAIASPH